MRVLLFIVLTFLSLMFPAVAQDMELPLRTLIEEFQAHRRVAIGYLRTGNADLGAFEIDQLRGRWQQGRRGLSSGLESDHVLTAALDETDTMLAQSASAANEGDLNRARALLESAARPLTNWRVSRAIRVFSDCIAEAGAAYELLDVHRLHAPDFTNTKMAERILVAATGTQAALNRCDAEAPAATRKDPEFRRLIDGFLASLAQMPEAVARRDDGYLHRLLIEQRSFERLLAFRFG